MLGVVLVDAHTVVGESNITKVLKGLGWMDLRSLFVVENALVELLHDESNTGYEFMHS